jgi:hypothetical protein
MEAEGEEFTRLFLSRPTALVYRQPQAGDWPENILRLEKRLFGEAFQRTPKNPCQAVFAVISPSPPLITDAIYWQYMTGLDGVRIDRKGIEDIAVIHEGGHNSFSLYDTKDENLLHISEVLADGFAIAKYLELGGPRDAVDDYICMRDIGGFMGGSLPRYSTGPACRALLDGKTPPPFDKVFKPNRELEIRVMDDLNGVQRYDLDAKAYQKEVTTCILYYERKVQKKGSIWTELNAPVQIGFEGFLPSEVMWSLDRVLKLSNLSDETRSAGENIKQAYKRLCPDEADEALRPRKIAPWVSRREPGFY